METPSVSEGRFLLGILHLGPLAYASGYYFNNLLERLQVPAHLHTP